MTLMSNEVLPASTMRVRTNAHAVRTMEADDRSAILRLVQATGNFNEDEVAIAKELIDIVVEQPDQKDYYAYVAYPTSMTETDRDSKISGFLLIGPTPATTGTYDMYWIAVDPAYQGQGVAQLLDSTAVDFVRARSGYLLIAETSSQPSYERTRAFYHKQGYSVVARIPDYYKPGDDLIVFGKRVHETV